MNNDFASRLVKAYKIHFGDEFISLVLFGSRARGDFKESSEFLWKWKSPKKPGWELDWSSIIEIV